MWRRRTTALQMARLVETPTGNVRLALPTPRPPTATLTAVGPVSATGTTTLPDEPGWSIRDGDGNVVASGLPSRSAALRAIGAIAIRARCAPYEVLDPTGAPTGDRLS